MPGGREEPVENVRDAEPANAEEPVNLVATANEPGGGLGVSPVGDPSEMRRRIAAAAESRRFVAF